MGINEDLISSFREYLFVERRLSKATVSCYCAEVSRYLEALGDIKVEEAGVDNVTEYLGMRSREKELSGRTSSRIITILRCFNNYLIVEKIRTDNPLELIGQVKVHKNLPGVLESGEVDRVLSQIDDSSELGQRDLTMFEAIYSCGLRVSEAVDLKVSDFDVKQRLFRVIGKGNKQRIVLVGQTLMDYLSVYLTRTRPVLVKSNPRCRYLFVGRRGQQLTRALVWKRFKEYCARAGVDAKVHTLRHSFATHMLQGGADLRVVQELLGHRDIRTTQIYTHVDVRQLQDAFDKFHPDGKNRK